VFPDADLYHQNMAAIISYQKKYSLMNLAVEANGSQPTTRLGGITGVRLVRFILRGSHCYLVSCASIRI